MSSVTRLFLGGTVLTMDRGRTASALAVTGGRIEAVGDESLRRRYPEAIVEDLDGRIVCPGFIDAHNHLSVAALHPRWADLGAVTDVDALGRALEAAAEREPAAPWIRGFGWNELTGGYTPHRPDLDALGFDRPVVVAHYSLHQCVVDSRALAELGIGRSTPDPPGGEIGRDPDGEPNGLLVERAWGVAHARSLAAYAEADRWGEHIVARAEALRRDGITAVHDAATSPEAEAVYARLARTGQLPLSILAMPHPAAILAPPDEGRLAGPPTGDGDETFRVGALKLFADGGVVPAIDVHLGGQRIRFGRLFDGLDDQVQVATERGFDIAIHAIGNAGLDAALDALDTVPSGRARRARVEHACLAGPDQIARMAAAGVAAVVQPGFVHHVGAQAEGADFDDATWLPFRDLEVAGVPIAGSSDDPCTFHEPLRTSSCGATRRTATGGVLRADQAVTLERWLEAYTAGAADAGGQTDERGRLRPGLRADLVVLDGSLDPWNPPAVAQTWVAGECVHDINSPAGP
jgi:predicted amidohydrolase YtcJ